MVRATTTRSLRLQSEEEANAAKPGPASITAARLPSQRVRLKLDPEVATKPLPEFMRLEPPAPAIEPVQAPMEAEPADAPADETLSPPSGEVPSEARLESAAEQTEPVASDSEFVPEPEMEPQQPVQDETAGQQILEEPLPTSTAPIRPKLTRSQGYGPPVSRSQAAAMNIRPGASSPISLSRMARGERAARRRFAARASEKEEIAPIVMASPAAPAGSDSQPLSRPELRRPSAKPLAKMTRPERSLGAGFWVLLVLVIILFAAVIYFFGVIPKVTAFVAARLHPRVQVHPPVPVAERAVAYAVARWAMTPVELSLSGTIEPFQQTALYARTTGYVRDWLVDIGDPVQAGQVLAELDTPDVDHQLTQARATADQAKAHLTLAQDEARRWDAMAAAHAVSQQDADEKDTTRDEAQASFNAAQANVARLVDMELFKEIRAPYAGRITARNLEKGTLVAAGPGAAGSELFRVAQTDPVRVFVDVPEASAPSIQAGLTARIEVASFPDRIFNGTVVRNAGILDNATHTLRTELSVANPDGALLPGARAGVCLQLHDTIPTVLVPADTIITRSEGPSVARLTETAGRDIVRLTPVKVGRDFGAEVEVLDNVREGDRLVAHPPADLQDGTAVNARPLEESPIPSIIPPKPSAPRA